MGGETKKRMVGSPFVIHNTITNLNGKINILGYSEESFVQYLFLQPHTNGLDRLEFFFVERVFIGICNLSPFLWIRVHRERLKFGFESNDV